MPPRHVGADEPADPELRPLRAKDEACGHRTAIEVASAYTSQTCSCCGYTDKRNRSAQKFQRRFCGNRMHADVNASRNVGSERFRYLGSPTPGFRQSILDTLVSQHVERYSRERGASSDPRKSNPYFKGADDRGEVIPSRGRPTSRRRSCKRERRALFNINCGIAIRDKISEMTSRSRRSLW